jgi:hypothetical protein
VTDLELAKYVAELVRQEVVGHGTLRCRITVDFRGRTREVWEKRWTEEFDGRSYDHIDTLDKMVAMMPSIKAAIHLIGENECTPPRSEKDVKRAIERLSSAAGIRAILDLAKLELRA